MAGEIVACLSGLAVAARTTLALSTAFLFLLLHYGTVYEDGSFLIPVTVNGQAYSACPPAELCSVQ